MFKKTGGKKSNQKTLNLVIAGVLSQVGFITVVIVLAALMGGLWLDAHFETKPLFIFILLIISIPITIYLMLVIVRKAQAKIKPVVSKKKAEGPEERGDELSE